VTAILGFAPTVLAGVFAVVFFGGFVKGVAGFGYAIASTAILAAALDPAVAVVVMIIPVIAANVRLLGELDRAEATRCLRRFWPYIASALVGTLAGMALLATIRVTVVTALLGAFTLVYVLLTQPYVTLPGQHALTERCFRPGTGWKVVLGAISGVIFGASNAAVQVVAYLDALSLDRSTFVGVLAMILIGVASVRIVAAWHLGLYGSLSRVAVSALAAGPGLAGVAAGTRVRDRIPERYQTAGVLVLLSIIGLRLTRAGLAGL
jgi:uncharacterized membrane protein YfcA